MTRRSIPRCKSKFRRPMSKSTTQVFLPRLASPKAKLAAEVVFPTPPLPDVTHTTRPLVPCPESTSDGWDSTNLWDEDDEKSRVDRRMDPHLFCGCCNTCANPPVVRLLMDLDPSCRNCNTLRRAAGVEQRARAAAVTRTQTAMVSSDRLA
eukprot:scaffold14043_cov41-Attheya_sp.AAC.2